MGNFLAGTGAIAVTAHPSGVAYSPDGRYIAVAEIQDHRIRFINVASGVSTTVAGFKHPGSVRYSPDGRYVAVGNLYGHNVLLINVATKGVTTLKRTHPTDDTYNDGVSFSPDGRYIAVALTIKHKIQLISLGKQQIGKQQSWQTGFGQYVKYQNCDSLSVGGSARILGASGETFVVDTDTSLNSNVTISGELDVGGDVSLNKNVTISGGLDVGGNTVLTTTSDLNAAKLTGTIPSSYNLLTTTSSLDSTKLTGTIPSSYNLLTTSSSLNAANLSGAASLTSLACTSINGVTVSGTNGAWTSATITGTTKVYGQGRLVTGVTNLLSIGELWLNTQGYIGAMWFRVMLNSNTPACTSIARLTTSTPLAGTITFKLRALKMGYLEQEIRE